MSQPPAYQVFVGVDIAAITFTAVWADGQRPATFAQTADGFTAFQQHLTTMASDHRAVLILMEATSSYWVALAVALHASGFGVSVMNPKVIHHYAKTLPRRSKT